ICYIVFLTAEFSIGRVLVSSGVAEIIREHLLLVLPDTGSFWFLPVIVAAVMGLHMIMGSITIVLPQQHRDIVLILLPVTL
ncbi:MAG TPA: hypothetical protein VN381_16100, partial [Anaerovoracaceae bacterium]|nr:hypothetical protein [Anaerovoracaceae bacterium]